LFAVLDACAVINLLQAFDDDSYFGLIESEFTRVFIAQEKVIEEIHRNKYDNLLTPASKEDERSLQLRRQEIDDIISRRVRNYVFPKDTVECQNFLSKATGYRKKNGEFYSVALSLYLSRMDGVEKICEQLLDVHFVTDDLGVSNDFGTFFRVNQIGNLIDSIDIMTILYLRGRITKADLENFCFTLKSLYSRTHAELIKRIKLAQNVEKDTRISSLLTSIVDYLVVR